MSEQRGSELKTITVLRPGSRVKLPNGDEGLVLRAALDLDGGVQYEVAYWREERKVDWLHPSEVDPRGARTVRMGFHPGNGGDTVWREEEH